MSVLRRMLVFCLLLQVMAGGLAGQNASKSYYNDSLFYNRKKPLLALGEVLFINGGVWAFDRYVGKHEFAFVDWHSIKENLRAGFHWDNDVMGTNYLSHPYHGSLYFNSARSNGMSFYQSIPFAATGSLVWELFLENEAPSINDLVATTVGGTMFGEILYRTSHLILNNSKRGANRALREISAGILSPVQGVNRVLTSAAWRQSDYNLLDDVPFDLSVSVGWRLLRPKLEADYLSYAEVATFLEYNPHREDCEVPYDCFSLYLAVDIGRRTLLFRQLNASALLWGRDVYESKKGKWYFGIYQNLDYWDSPGKEYKRTPYRYSQVAAIGSGLSYNSFPGQNTQVSFTAMVNGVGMGASSSDYYWVGDRDYNFGSGFGVQTKAELQLFDSTLRFKLFANNSTLYTWKGYDPTINLYAKGLNELNAQGDKGHGNFTFVEASLGYYSCNSWSLEFLSEFINRHTYYKLHPAKNYSAWSYSVRLGYHM